MIEILHVFTHKLFSTLAPLKSSQQIELKYFFTLCIKLIIKTITSQLLLEGKNISKHKDAKNLNNSLIHPLKLQFDVIGG